MGSNSVKIYFSSFENGSTVQGRENTSCNGLLWKNFHEMSKAISEENSFLLEYLISEEACCLVKSSREIPQVYPFTLTNDITVFSVDCSGTSLGSCVSTLFACTTVRIFRVITITPDKKLFTLKKN